MVGTAQEIKFLYLFYKKTWQIIKTRLHSKEWEGGLPLYNFEFLKTEQDIQKKSFAPPHVQPLICTYKIASGTNAGELFIFSMLIFTNDCLNQTQFKTELHEGTGK